MNRKAQTTLMIILIILASIIILKPLMDSQISKEKSPTHTSSLGPPMLQIDEYFDAFGASLDASGVKPLAIINGIKNVKFITLKINVKNLDTIPVTISVKELTPSGIDPTAIPSEIITVQSGRIGSFITGKIDIEKYEGGIQDFCATIESQSSSIRKADSKSACISIDIQPNIEIGRPSPPFPIYDPIAYTNIPGTTPSTGDGSIIIIDEDTQNNDAAINPSCTESWACDNWDTCTDNVQYRSCTDLNDCGTFTYEPAIARSCVSSTQPVIFRTSDIRYGVSTAVGYSSSCGSTLTKYGHFSTACRAATDATCPTITGFTLRQSNLPGGPTWAQQGTGCLYKNDGDATRVYTYFKTTGSGGPCGSLTGQWAGNSYDSDDSDKTKVSDTSFSSNLALEKSCSQSSAPPSSACTENWQCSNWNTCTNNIQSRTCSDVNSCGTTVNKPATSQSCVSAPVQSVSFRTGATNYAYTSLCGNLDGDKWVAYTNSCGSSLTPYGYVTKNTVAASQSIKCDRIGSFIFNIPYTKGNPRSSCAVNTIGDGIAKLYSCGAGKVCVCENNIDTKGYVYLTFSSSDTDAGSAITSLTSTDSSKELMCQ